MVEGMLYGLFEGNINSDHNARWNDKDLKSVNNLYCSSLFLSLDAAGLRALLSGFIQARL